MLTGKYRRGEPLPESVRAEENAQRRFTDKNWHILETLVQVAQDTGRTPAQTAIGWLLSKPWVSAPIIGANTPEQLLDTMSGLDQALPPEALARLDDASSFRRGRSSLEQLVGLEQ